MNLNVIPMAAVLQPVKQRRIKPKDYLHPIEVAIVTAYLRSRAQPLEALPEDWYAPERQDDEDEDDSLPPQPVRLARLGTYCTRETELSNAVARLCLNAVQDRLPQWGVSRSEGEMLFARAYEERRGTALELVPQHLFTINWADSGPGFSWPEEYHATFLPGFNRWVVTASADSDDMYGCTDLAVGSFPVGSDIVRSSGRVLVSYWRRDHSWREDYGWAYLFDTGLVDQATACRWRSRAWGRGSHY